MSEKKSARLTMDEWDEVLDALDFMAGGSELSQHVYNVLNEQIYPPGSPPNQTVYEL